MIRRLSEKLLIGPEDLQPSREDFAVIGVFNPGVVRVGNETVLMARVAEKPLEHRPGFVGLPRSESNGEIVVDWVREEHLDPVDARVVRSKKDDLLRLTSISHLRIFRSQGDGLSDWKPDLAFLPESRMEEFGVEDPRITEIEGTYWMTYVAVSRHGVATALASTEDWMTFERHGMIFPPENKDVVLFPHQIGGKYMALHRPTPQSAFSRPEIWLARSDDLLHWGQHEFLYGGDALWEGGRIGAGSPPIAIDEGWLEIYHGSHRTRSDGEVGAYSAGALLLDREHPSRILKRTCEPIIQPTAEFERSGFVPDVVFPTALVDQGETIQVYYGAADTFIGVVEFSRAELINALH